MKPPTGETEHKELKTGLGLAHAAKTDRPVYFSMGLKDAKPCVLLIDRKTVAADKFHRAMKHHGGRGFVNGVCFEEKGKIIFEVPKEPNPAWAAGVNHLASAAGLTIHAEFRKGRDPLNVPEPTDEPNQAVETDGQQWQQPRRPGDAAKKPEEDAVAKPQDKEAAIQKAKELLRKLETSGLPPDLLKRYKLLISKSLQQGPDELGKIDSMINVAIARNKQNEGRAAKNLEEAAAKKPESEAVRLKAEQLQQELQSSGLPLSLVKKFSDAISSPAAQTLGTLVQIDQMIKGAIARNKQSAERPATKVEKAAATTPEEKQAAEQKARELQEKLQRLDLPDEAIVTKFTTFITQAAESMDLAVLEKIDQQLDQLGVKRQAAIQKSVEELQSKLRNSGLPPDQLNTFDQHISNFQQQPRRQMATQIAQMIDEAIANHKQLEEEAAAKKLEEEAAAKKLEEEAAAKKLEEEAAAKKLEEEAAAKKLEEEAAAKKLEDEAATKQKARELLQKVESSGFPESSASFKGYIEDALQHNDRSKLERFDKLLDGLIAKRREKIERDADRLDLSSQEKKALLGLNTTRPQVATSVAQLLDSLSAGKSLTGSGKSLEEANAEFALAKETNVKAAADRESAVNVNNVALAELTRIQETKGNDKVALEEYKQANAKAHAADAHRRETEEKLAAAKHKQEDAQKVHDSKTLLLDAVRFGPLSGKDTGRLTEETMLEFVAGFKTNPQLASKALDMAQFAQHPEVLAKGLKVLGSADFGNWNAATVAKMVTNAFKMGDRLGGDYFERLEAFYKADKQKVAASVQSSGDENWLQNKGNAYTKALATQVVDSTTGNVNFAAPAAQGVMDELLFHPASLLNPLPALAEQFEKVRKDFTGPNKDAYLRVLNGVPAPTNASAQELVKNTLGLREDEQPTAVDGKRTVVATRLTTFDQGNVGSCFGTAPCRKHSEEQPLKFLEDLAAIVKNGTLSKGGQPPLPVITNLPPGDNPLLRSWEYTMATAGSRSANSKEKQQLGTSLFGGFAGQTPDNSLAELARDFPSTDWPAKKAQIERGLADAFAFTYDPTVDSGPSADGSSTKGAFVMKYKENPRANEVPVTSEDNFIVALKKVVQKAINPTNDVTLNNKIDGLVQKPAFLANLKQAYSDGAKSPWDLPAGGQEKDVTQLLFGGNRTAQELFNPASATTEGDKASVLLTGVVEKLMAQNDSMVIVSVSAIHAMNLLPKHPSLDKLKSGDSVAANVQQHLKEASQTIAATALEPDHLAHLYDKALAGLVADDQARNEAKATKPNRAMTPAEFKAHVRENAPSIDANAIDSFLLKELKYPEFTLADTNWGNQQEHQFMVIAPDPSTGEPALWKKGDFTGAHARMESDWLEKDWKFMG